MFDTQDELYKLIARFNQFAIQEIASTVSQISLLLERYHHETSTAIAGVSQKVDLIHQDTKDTNERVRRYSDLLEKIAAGIPHVHPLLITPRRSTRLRPRFSYRNRNFEKMAQGPSQHRRRLHQFQTS